MRCTLLLVCSSISNQPEKEIVTVSVGAACSYSYTIVNYKQKAKRQIELMSSQLCIVVMCSSVSIENNHIH